MKFDSKFDKMCDLILEQDLTAIDIYGPSFMQRLQMIKNEEEYEEPQVGDIVYLEINGNLDPQISVGKDKTCFVGVFKIKKKTKSELSLVPYYEIFKDSGLDNNTDVNTEFNDEPIIKLSANKEINFKNQYEKFGKIVPDELNKPITIELDKSKIYRMPNDSELQPKWHIITCNWEPWDSKIFQMKD